ncbi:MAG: SycD/LcrH family type III secretion system chaperone [Chlamydiales bacterium]|nr:SycD/LcrH family type III secretion system chaperone [Chlamydiales bacterium]
MRLKTLLRRIALQRQEEFPFPEDIESYVEEFVPNVLLKSETLQRAFGITDYEMEKLYEEAYELYEANAYQEALNLFRWLLLFNSYEAKYWMGFAAALQLLERYEKALHAYAVASLLDSKSPYPHFHAYECYILLNNRDDADKALKLAYQRCDGKAAYDELKNEIERSLPRAALI